MLQRILVIEDDPDIANLVELHLCDLGMEVEVANDGQVGWDKLSQNSYDLVVLDLALPSLDGLEICRRLRAQPEYTSILMLTSKGTELDRVVGLELGADDYLTKPFSIRELVARVKALFRRETVHQRRRETGALPCPSSLVSASGTVIDIGAMHIEMEKHKVVVAGESVTLTAREFDLLVQFACHPGRVYTRAQLLDLVWGLSYEGYEHTVNSHINRLRGKIEVDAAHPRYLLTVWGTGYKFAEA